MKFKKAVKLIQEGYVVINDNKNIELLKQLFSHFKNWEDKDFECFSFICKDGSWNFRNKKESFNNFIYLSSIKIPKTEYQKKYLSKKSFKKEVKKILKSGYEPSEKLDLIKELCEK